MNEERENGWVLEWVRESVSGRVTRLASERGGGRGWVHGEGGRKSWSSVVGWLCEDTWKTGNTHPPGNKQRGWRAAASQLVWMACDLLCLNFTVSGHEVNSNPHAGQHVACCCSFCREMSDHNYAFAGFFGTSKVTDRNLQSMWFIAASSGHSQELKWPKSCRGKELPDS